MFWKKKNVFVTGADGFIGSWIAKEAVNRGANVFILARDLKKPKTSLDYHDLRKNTTIIQGDITDYDCILKILNEKSIDTIFHLAAQPIVWVASRNPSSTFNTNIKGTWTLLEAARNVPTVKRVVVASSDKAYGDQKVLPYTEDQPLNGLYPYDASKSCTDIIARCYHKTFGLPVAVTRCANTYGGADFHLDRIVPGTVVSVLKGDVPIIRSDGKLERDYIYISDVVDAYFAIAENLDKEEIQGQAFNIGTEKPISVLDLFNMIIRLCGKDVGPKVLNEAKYEIKKQYLAIGKAKNLLGWEPKVSLEEGLKSTIDWYREHIEDIKNII